ncbi:MAG: hypothetical protein M1833_003945 [Piccolia ochrophora]|nr:MAG: hypothetical protein M1833_003945 [Piccolia ochrophora]
MQNYVSSPGMSVSYARGDNAGVGSGPGPMRHPRPLTAAELHLELEKEQEAVVNRLTRELSQLRAQQSASVASTTSSTSAGLPDPSDPHSSSHLLSGPTHQSSSSRPHQRSSSSTSVRSITAPASNATGSTPAWSTTGGLGSSISLAHPHETTVPSQASAERARDSLSRQHSVTSSRRSGASSPSLSSAHSSVQPSDNFPLYYHHRPSLSSHQSQNLPPHSAHSTQASAGTDQALSPPTAGVATARYEETVHHRAELEAVKRENETLRRRIRDLERAVQSRRQSTSESGRSTSQSVASSVPRPDRSGSDARGAMGRGAADEPVRVGESAGNAGLERAS